MPAVITDVALGLLEGSNDRRVHLVRPETIEPLGNGLYRAVTLCGEVIVGSPVRNAKPTCECCIAAR